MSAHSARGLRPLISAFALALSGVALPALAATVASPDGRIVLTLDADHEGVPF